MIINPRGHCIQQFIANLGIFASGPSRHVKGMVGVLKQFHGGASAKLLAERLKKLQVRKLIASSLEEQHRNVYIEEMFRALI